MAFTSINEVIKLVKNWEVKLEIFYVALEDFLVNDQSRKVAAVLCKNQKKMLDVLNQLKPGDYKTEKYVKFIPDYHKEDILPRYEIPANSSPKELLDKVLDYEEKLEKYYTRVQDIVVYTKSKELFEMLSKFKLAQIKGIKSCRDSF